MVNKSLGPDPRGDISDARGARLARLQEVDFRLLLVSALRLKRGVRGSECKSSVRSGARCLPRRENPAFRFGPFDIPQVKCRGPRWSVHSGAAQFWSQWASVADFHSIKRSEGRFLCEKRVAAEPPDCSAALSFGFCRSI